MRLDFTSNRGVALITALFVLALAGTLVGAAFFAAQASLGAARMQAGATALEAAADGLLTTVVETWDTPARLAQPLGATASPAATWSDPNIAAESWITRLSPRAYWLVARVATARGLALSARAGAIVRIDAPQFPTIAALVARGGVVFGGTASVVTDDVPRPIPGCDSVPHPVEQIVLPPGPPAPRGAVRLAVAGADSTYTRFGGMQLTALQSRATTSFLPNATTSPPSVTIAWATGDLTLKPGSAKEFSSSAGASTFRVP